MKRPLRRGAEPQLPIQPFRHRLRLDILAARFQGGRASRAAAADHALRVQAGRKAAEGGQFLSRYPVLKIHATIARQAHRKESVMPCHYHGRGGRESTAAMIASLAPPRWLTITVRARLIRHPFGLADHIERCPWF